MWNHSKGQLSVLTMPEQYVQWGVDCLLETNRCKQTQTLHMRSVFPEWFQWSTKALTPSNICSLGCYGTGQCEEHVALSSIHLLLLCHNLQEWKTKQDHYTIACCVNSSLYTGTTSTGDGGACLRRTDLSGGVGGGAGDCFDSSPEKSFVINH